MKLKKLEIMAKCHNGFETAVIEKIVSAEAYNEAERIVVAARGGDTQYITTVTEEAVARLLHTSACNADCRIRRRYFAA